MRFTVDRLVTDVMARLGEIARPQASVSDSGVPWPEDVVALRAASLLGEVGSRLIRDASWETLGAGVPVDAPVLMRLMPCGLYGARIPLPEGFLRLTSLRMSGWTGCVCRPVTPESSDWLRRWSAEPGIAGCPEAPRAYIDRDGEGIMLWALGSVSEDEELEWLCGWSVPEADEEGGFEFPFGLYPELVRDIAGRL